jgi:hypothetical protein
MARCLHCTTNSSIKDMTFAMKQPFFSFGSDGSALNIANAAGTSPHPSSYGTYARRMGRYVRDLTVTTPEEGVHKSDIT